MVHTLPYTKNRENAQTQHFSLGISNQHHMWAINFNGIFLDLSALCKCRLIALHKPFNTSSLIFLKPAKFCRNVSAANVGSQKGNIFATPVPPSTRARYSVKNFQPKCLFCDREDSGENLTQVHTFELDRKVHDAASQLCEENLLARLSEGDMIAVEALYDKTRLSALCNRLGELRSFRPKADSDNASIEGSVLAKILYYLKSSNESLAAILLFKLSDIKSLYSQRSIKKIHSTRLKEKILGRIPELHESQKGRDVRESVRQ